MSPFYRPKSMLVAFLRDFFVHKWSVMALNGVFSWYPYPVEPVLSCGTCVIPVGDRLIQV